MTFSSGFEQTYHPYEPTENVDWKKRNSSQFTCSNGCRLLMFLAAFFHGFFAPQFVSNSVFAQNWVLGIDESPGIGGASCSDAQMSARNRCYPREITSWGQCRCNPMETRCTAEAFCGSFELKYMALAGTLDPGARGTMTFRSFYSIDDAITGALDACEEEYGEPCDLIAHLASGCVALLTGEFGIFPIFGADSRSTEHAAISWSGDAGIAYDLRLLECTEDVD